MCKFSSSLLCLVPFIGACGGPEPPPEILAVVANDFDEIVDHLDHEGLDTLPGSCWGSFLQDSRGIDTMFYEFTEDGDFRSIMFVDVWTRDEQFQDQDMPYADLFALVPPGGLTGRTTMLTIEEGTYTIDGDSSVTAILSRRLSVSAFETLDTPLQSSRPYEVTIQGDYMTIFHANVDQDIQWPGTFHRFDECPSGSAG